MPLAHTRIQERRKEHGSRRGGRLQMMMNCYKTMIEESVGPV
jgi:hypothetical protein